MSTGTPSSRIRLSIAHLLLWTLGSAIVLTFFRAVAREEWPGQRFAQIWPLYILCYSLLAGAKVAAVLFFAGRFFRGIGGFPTQPGHWLLLVEGVSIVLSWGGRLLERLADEKGAYAFAFSMALQLPNCVFTAILYAVALHAQRPNDRLWKTVMTILLLHHAIAALLIAVLILPLLLTDQRPPATAFAASEFFSMQTCCFVGLFVAFLLPATAFDPERRERDFLHWTGVICVLGTYVLTFSVSYLLRAF